MECELSFCHEPATSTVEVLGVMRHVCGTHAGQALSMEDENNVQREIAVELVAELERLEQEAPGSDSYDVTLDEFRRMRSNYPITTARAIETVLLRGPRHWDKAPTTNQDQPKPF